MNRKNFSQRRRPRLHDKFTVSTCYCPVCNSQMMVPRIRNREKFHKKDLWCPVCKKKQTMIEIRSFDFYKNMLGERLN